MPKTPRIYVRFYDPGDGTPIRFQAIHWSPPKREWPHYVREAVENLKEQMDRALNE